MENHMKRFCILSIGFLFLGAQVLSGEKLERELPTKSGDRLTVDIETGGSIEISAWDKESVKVEVDKRGRDADRTDVRIEEDVDGISITARFDGRRKNTSSDLRFRIQVPKKYDLDIESMGGAVKIDGVEGTMEGRTMGGELDFSNLRGRLDFVTMGGEITLRQSDVDGSVKTMGGRVLVEDVTGGVKATSQGGEITQRNVKRRSGEAKGTDVNINTMGGDINVDDAPDGANVHTMGGDIRIRSAAKFAKAKTMGGNIEISAVDGSVQATTMGGDITVTMVGNASDGKRDVEISSMGGEVTLTVPADLSMELEVTLAYTRDSDGDYQILSDFPLQQEHTKEWKRDDGSPRKYIYGTGSVGGGKNKVRIKTINGDIRLKKG